MGFSSPPVRENPRFHSPVADSNFENLKNIKVPVLITDGRSDAIDQPKNSLLIANQIPFSWLAYFWGGYSFLYTEPKHFADTVNVFLQ